MRGLMLAALVEAGLITWRDLSKDKTMPLPSDFVAVAIFYGGLGLFPASAGTFTSFVGWGMVVATFLGLWDPTNPVALVLPGKTSQASAAAILGQPQSQPSAVPAPAGAPYVGTVNPVTGLATGVSLTGGGTQSIHP